MEESAAVAARRAASGQVLQAGGALFPMSLVAELEAQLTAAVGGYHTAHPLSEGMPREEARERVFGHASPALFDAVLGRLEAAKRVSGRDRLALPGQGVSLSAEEAQAQLALDRVFGEAGLAPPDIPTAAAAAGIQPVVADRVAKLLLRQKTLVKVDTLLFHREALEKLKAEVKGLRGQGAAKVDVAGFKERYGISRKYAIPLLEWLDRERVTRRVGDGRVVL
jgi:selenocysteine-specific elongation factor